MCTTLNDYTEVILLGDFNFSPSTIGTLNSHLSTVGLTQLVTAPTHIKGATLDLIFTRVSSSIVSSLDVNECLSDHFAVSFSLCIKKPPPSHAQEFLIVN